MANNRKCLCCGKKYDFCTSCTEHKGKPSWMYDYDTEECKDLFNAVSGYNMGIFKENKIKEVIKKYDIKDYSKYTKPIQEVLNSITTVKRNKRSKKTMDVDSDRKQTSK